MLRLNKKVTEHAIFLFPKHCIIIAMGIMEKFQGEILINWFTILCLQKENIKLLQNTIIL